MCIIQYIPSLGEQYFHTHNACVVRMNTLLSPWGYVRNDTNPLLIASYHNASRYIRMTALMLISLQDNPMWYSTIRKRWDRIIIYEPDPWWLFLFKHDGWLYIILPFFISHNWSQLDNKRSFKRTPRMSYALILTIKAILRPWKVSLVKIKHCLRREIRHKTGSIRISNIFATYNKIQIKKHKQK